MGIESAWRSGDRLDLDLNSLRLQVSVCNPPQFEGDALHAQAGIAEMFTRQHIDFYQCLVVLHVAKGFFSRKDQIEIARQFLEGQHELEAQVLVEQDLLPVHLIRFLVRRGHDAQGRGLG